MNIIVDLFKECFRHKPLKLTTTIEIRKIKVREKQKEIIIETTLIYTKHIFKNNGIIEKKKTDAQFKT